MAPRSGGAGARRQLDDAGDRCLGRRLRRRHQQPVVGPDEAQRPARWQRHLEADAPARRADAGVDDAEHDARAEMRHRPHQRVAARPHVEGRDVMGEVDDGRPRRRAAITACTTPANSSSVPKSERKKTVRGGLAQLVMAGALSAAGCASVRWRPPPPP